jgi:hypothetical protein
VRVAELLRLVPVPAPKLRGVAWGSGFEVDLYRLDERDEPGEEFEMDGMGIVGVHRGAVGELHDTGKLVPQRTGREVDADVRLEDPGIWVWRPRIVSWARCFWASVVPGFHRKKKVWMTMRLL